MSNIIFKELDPFFETIGLLAAINNIDTIKKETLKSLDELGYDGEKFYAKHLKIYDNYVNTFKKNSILNNDSTFFFEDGYSDFTFFTLILPSLLIENKDFISKIDEIDGGELNKEIIEISKQLFDITTSVDKVETLEDIVAFLDMTSMDKNAKWKTMLIMQNPKSYFKKLIGIIQINLSAFEKAKNAVEPQLAKLISQYNEVISTGSKGPFFKLKSSLARTSDIYPTLALPLSQVVFEKNCYYGLLSSLVLKEEKNNQSKDQIIQCLKALSDKSKLEILSSLKVSPKYNLEIAEQLGLTAATMSHHMNVLLTCGFVSVSKQSGRVYYHIEKDSIRNFISSLESTLL